MLMDDLRAASRAGQIEIYPFNYSAIFPIANFAAAAVLPINININNESDFIIREAMLAAYSAGGVPVVMPDITVTLFDTGSGRLWQDQAQHATNIFGTAQLPYLWPEPVKVAGGSIMTVTATNNQGVAMLVYMTFAGFKVINKSGYTR